jgi:hypothetical protein
MLQKIPGIGKLDVEVSSPDVWSWLSGESNPPEELQEQVSHILGLLAVYDYEVMQEL